MNDTRVARPTSFRPALIVVLTAAVLLPAAAWAQETRATISGTIRDAQGAVVPGVTVSGVPRVPVVSFWFRWEPQRTSGTRGT
jgi:hypothetical protein